MVAAVVLSSWILAAQPPSAHVALDLRRLSWTEYHQLDGLELQRKASLRLVEDGFAVVSLDSGAAEIVVRVSLEADAVGVDASAGERTLHREIRLDGKVAAWHLEIAQKVSELCQTLLAQHAVAPPASPVPLQRTEPSPEDRWEVGVSLGAVARQAAIDPLALATLRFGRGALRLRVEAGLAGSSSAAISVYEAEAGAGPAYRLTLFDSLELEGAVELGGVLQTYRVSASPVAAPSGSVTSAAVWVPLLLRWRPFRSLSLGLRAAVGTSRSFTHVYEGNTLWARGSLRGEGGLGAGWVF